MSLIFLVQADLHDQPRECFVSSRDIRQIAMPQHTYLQAGKAVVPRVVLCAQDGVADPNIAHRKRSSFFIIDEGETEEGDKVFG